MKHLLQIVTIMLACTLLTGPAWAKDGLYLGMDVGVAVAPDMDIKTGGLDDWSSSDVSATRCDVTINPNQVQVGPGECASEPQPWGPLAESFDGGAGVLAGLSAGYRVGAFRVEGEYFYRNAEHNSTANPYPAGVAPRGGYHTIEDAVDDTLSHNFFANLYYDYRSESKFTPYVGAGIGVARVTVAYRTLWQRSLNVDDITVFETANPNPDGEGQFEDTARLDPDPGASLNERLVGALSYDRANMTDTLFGYQVLAGVDYQMSEPVTIGLKFRWAGYSDFEAESAYTQLRGHASVAGNPPVPVTYYIQTDDIQFWGVSLNMKYAF